MKCGIVIVNYNSFDLTLNFCKELLQQKNIILYIVIVDNNSNRRSGADELERFVKIHKNIHYLQNNENSGYAKGNNIGIKFLESYLKEKECVIVANNDLNFTESDTLYELVLEAESQRNAFISPLILEESGNITPNYAVKRRGWLYDIMLLTPFRFMLPSILYKEIREYVDILPGCFILSLLKNWKSVDYFDEDTFLYGEERILAEKIRKCSLISRISIANRVIHKCSSVVSSNVSNKKKMDYILQGRCIYHKKYNSKIKYKILKMIIEWKK